MCFKMLLMFIAAPFIKGQTFDVVECVMERFIFEINNCLVYIKIGFVKYLGLPMNPSRFLGSYPLINDSNYIMFASQYDSH